MGAVFCLFYSLYHQSFLMLRTQKPVLSMILPSVVEIFWSVALITYKIIGKLAKLRARLLPIAIFGHGLNQTTVEVVKNIASLNLKMVAFLWKVLFLDPAIVDYTILFE